MLILILGQRMFNEDCSTIIVQALPPINVIQDPPSKNDIASIPRSWFIWGKPSKKKAFQQKQGQNVTWFVWTIPIHLENIWTELHARKIFTFVSLSRRMYSSLLTAEPVSAKKKLISAKSEIFLPAWICCQLILISCENFQNTTTCYLQSSLS